MYIDRFRSYTDVVFNIKFFATEVVVFAALLFPVIFFTSDLISPDRYKSRIFVTIDFNNICLGSNELCEVYSVHDNIARLSRTLSYRPSRDEYGRIGSEVVRNAVSETNVPNKGGSFVSAIDVSVGLWEENLFIDVVSPNLEFSGLLSQNIYEVLESGVEQFVSDINSSYIIFSDGQFCTDNSEELNEFLSLCRKMQLVDIDNFSEIDPIKIEFRENEVVGNPLWFQVVTSLVTTMFIIALWLSFRMSKSPDFYSEEQLRNIISSFSSDGDGLGVSPSVKQFSTASFLGFCKDQRLRDGAHIIIIAPDSKALETISADIAMAIEKFFGPAISVGIFDESDVLRKITSNSMPFSETKNAAVPVFAVYTFCDRGDLPAVEPLGKSFDAVVLGVDWKKTSCLDFSNQLALFNSSDLPTFVFFL